MVAGYGGFTMRKVANRAGITIGNLNYYYRTREDLLRDLLEYVINDYLEEFERRRQIAGHSPEKQLLAVLKFWIEDLNTLGTTILFPGLLIFLNGSWIKKGDRVTALKLNDTVQGALSFSIRDWPPSPFLSEPSPAWRSAHFI